MKWLLILTLLLLAGGNVPGVRGSEPHRHKAALLHESEGARHKLPGHRRPGKGKIKHRIKGKLRPGVGGGRRETPTPPTSQPPYVFPDQRPPGWAPWGPHPKEPIP